MTFSALVMCPLKSCPNLLTRGPIARPQLNASRAPQVYVISFKNARFQLLFHHSFTFLSTVHLLKASSAFSLRTSNFELPSTRSSKGMIFLLRWLFPLIFCIDITAWACLFLSHSRSSSSFLCFTSSRSLAWGGFFLGFLSPFRLNPHLLNLFSSSFLSFPQWRVLKRRPILHPQGSTTKPFTRGPPMSCSMSAQA